LLAFTLAGCVEMLHSDSENASRRAHRARDESLRAMKLGSAQAAPGQVVTGEALPKMLAGQSHVSEYRKRVGDAKPYITVYDFFGNDGTFISRDTHGRRTPAYQTVGRWRVRAGLLCIATPSQPDESCYTIRLAADGALQYWIAKPGDPFDGLLTKSVRIVRPGLQEPEYVSDPAAFR